MLSTELQALRVETHLCLMELIAGRGEWAGLQAQASNATKATNCLGHLTRSAIVLNFGSYESF
jgi:hypothetical protein